MKRYETVIGLEVHVELATRTKIFCGCSTAFGGAPNEHTCPVCTGMPGALPVLNRQVVEDAIAVGLATNGAITRQSRFDRKNYFYPDNPQGYQISQLYAPICTGGHVELSAGGEKKAVRIREIHMEEDAGKLVHGEEGETLVDFNRSGVPLLEIVSEPDLRTAEEAVAYVEQLRLIVQYLGVCDGKMQEGSLRADVNVSVREEGTQELGTRTEMKNLNSFRAMTRAIEAESERQRKILEFGGEIVQETRRWDDSRGCSCPMRSKEDAKDYRYFPEPDLPPLVISDEWIARIRGRQPELREEKRARYQREYGLPEYDAELLTSSKRMADVFEETTALCAKPKEVSNWLMVEAMRLLRETGRGPEELSLDAEKFSTLIGLVSEGRINRAAAKEAFEALFLEDLDPAAYVAEHGLQMLNDDGLLQNTVEQVFLANPQSVEDYRRGKDRAMGFLVGQTMKALNVRADPAKVNALVRERLKAL